MPPKKGEAAFLADVATHRDWAVANLATLRGRSGQGLRARLRVLAGPTERRLHNWYARHEDAASACPRVAAALTALDALVDESPGAAASACPGDGPPATQRRSAENVDEPAASSPPIDRAETPAKQRRSAESGDDFPEE